MCSSDPVRAPVTTCPTHLPSGASPIRGEALCRCPIASLPNCLIPRLSKWWAVQDLNL